MHGATPGTAPLLCQSSCTSPGCWLLSWQAALAELPGCHFITAQAAERHRSSCFPWEQSWPGMLPGASSTTQAWNYSCWKRSLRSLSATSIKTNSDPFSFTPSFTSHTITGFTWWREQKWQKSNVKRLLLFSSTPWAVPREAGLPHGL